MTAVMAAYATGELERAVADHLDRLAPAVPTSASASRAAVRTLGASRAAC
jgi:hypothetical protein